MRRLVAALIVVALSLTLVGCGGGEEPAADTADTTPPPPAAPAATAEEPIVDRSPNEQVNDEPFPTGGTLETITPQAIKDNLEASQPMVIYFFDHTQPEYDDVNQAIDAALVDYRGIISKVAFDLRKAQPGEPEKDPEVLKASALADKLGVKRTPYTLIVDSQGLIVWRWAGAVETGMVEREFMRATQ